MSHLVDAVSVVAGELLPEDAGGEGEGGGVGLTLTARLHLVLREPQPPPGRPRHVGLQGEQVGPAGGVQLPLAGLLLHPVPLVALEVVADLPGPVLDEVVVPVGSRPGTGTSQGEHRAPGELAGVAGEDPVGDGPAVSVRVPAPALLQGHAEVRRVVVLEAVQDVLLDVDEPGLGLAVHNIPVLLVSQLLNSNPGDGVVVVCQL